MSAQTGWIDFRALRKELSFEKVLEHYGVKLKVKGKQATGFCPLPTHRGQRRSPSFSVQLEKDVFQCFGCSAKGNVLDFAARMEGLDPFKGGDIRKVAVMLKEKFGLSGGTGNQPKPGKAADDAAPGQAHEQPATAKNLPVVINEPLDFELKSLDTSHPYLSGRGFSEETVKTFGLGFCNRGLFKSRIVIPIHDGLGRLVGYAGRVVDERSISEENPKYKLPPRREREGKLFEFHKSLLLYGLHRLPAKVTDLVVVEGFPATWWLTQHGFTSTVAVMGSDCSEEQAKLILDRVEFDGRIWIMSDGDDGGTRLAQNLFERVGPYRFVRWVKLRDGEQPTSLTADELAAVLSL
jgi:DNA primase